MRQRNTRPIYATIAIALVTLGCGPRESKTFDTTSVTIAPAPAPTPGAAGGDVVPTVMTVRVADITGTPDKHMGHTVSVEADVDEVLSPYAFELDEDSPVAGGVDNDLIVLYPKSLSLAPLDNKWLNNKVRVTGTVRRMNVVEAERELEWDLTRKIEVEVSKRPVLIARSVERVPGP